MARQKTLVIKWQRLLIQGQTCPRCGATEDEVNRAVTLLRQSLAPLDIDVDLQKIELSAEQFKRDPQQSNAIWINDQLMEDWIGGQAGQSPCCDVCGPNECRTMSLGEDLYEVIPAELIVKAGLLAAAEILGGGKPGCFQSKPCCTKECDL